MRLTINPDDITLGDIVDFEEATEGADLTEILAPQVVKCSGKETCLYEHSHRKGQPVPDPEDEQGRPLKKMQNPKGKHMLAMMWIFLRKENPSLTLEDVRNTKVKDIEIEQPEAEGGESTEDPIEQAA